MEEPIARGDTVKSLKKITLLMTLAALPALFSGCLLLDMAADFYFSSEYQSTASTVSDVGYGDVRTILKRTHEKVHDRDGDGKVNCVDYTLTFKKEWDKSFPASRCEIVRNYNTSGRTEMNHLFVRVRLDTHDGWLYVEPQARYDSSKYKMSDFWGRPKYGPKYNHYGETDYWLGECRR